MAGPGAADAPAAGTTGSAEPAERKIPKPDFVRTASVYAASLSKPDAKGVFVDADDRMYGDIFNIVFPGSVVTNLAGGAVGYDIVFVEGQEVKARVSRAARNVVPGGVVACVVDASKLKASDFRKMLEGFPGDDVRLWMFSRSEWMLVGRSGDGKVAMSDMLEFFSRDGMISIGAEHSGCGSIQDVFASYAARREALMQVFDNAPGDAEVMPEHFLSEKIPPFDWIDTEGVDADIVDAISAAIYDRQHIRRVVVAAEVVSRDRNNLDEAVEMWAGAMKRNPTDTMLHDRLYRMAVNAKVFRDLGRLVEAAYCYETMMAIRPGDRRIGEEYVAILMQLGKRELALEVSNRLNELNDRPKGGKGSRYDVQ